MCTRKHIVSVENENDKAKKHLHTHYTTTKQQNNWKGVIILLL